MNFTDDDLKRLKEFCDRDDHLVIKVTSDNQRELLKPLLARLEAAEKCLAFHFDATDCQCEHCIVWRKSKGEAGK